MHATSVLASAIGSLAAIPVLWKQYKKDEGMFPKPEKRWSAAEAAACILLVMTFGHLLEYCNERDRLYQNLFRLSGHGIKDL